MRNLKKLAAVGLTAAMTLSMSLSAFAADVTIHFKNAANWENVGAWVYQGIGFDIQVMPADKCPAYNTNTNRAIWPGARMEKEEGYDGWYKLTCTFDDPSQGAVMLFNNMVADTTADTASGGDESDNQFLSASGLVQDTNAKQQTPNQLIKKTDFTGTEYWCDFDGNTSGSASLMLSAAPASYVQTAAPAAETTAAANTAGTATQATSAAVTSSVKTGDSVTYAIVFMGIAAAGVFVASRRKVTE